MKLYISDAKWGKTTIYRQTSQFSGIAGSHIWSSFPDTDYDFLVSFGTDELSDSMRGYPKKKRVFVMHENPLVWKPNKEELDQFGIIISPWASIRDSLTDQLLIQAHSGVPWFYGIDFRTDKGLLHQPLRTSKELDYLCGSRQLGKTKTASFIVSGKGWLEGHKWRIAVANALNNKYPGKIDIFGFGHKPLPDKALALDRYRFSIVIENTPSEYYWTEKLADCILGSATPIYSGASNAKRELGIDFPTINFGGDPEKTAEIIMRITEDYEIDSGAIDSCRQGILKQHNFMYWIPRLLESQIS
mgnify:CR=1 FL=1